METSLGYFITPLFTVLLGVLVLKERLRRWQWIALGIAFVAVIGLTIENGRPPWVALILTFSFGLYGLAKKQAGAGAIEGMAIETATVAPVALVAILVLGAQGQSTVADYGAGYLIVVLLAGPITSVPLMLFGAASTRVSMTTLGLLNYITPSMQFALACCSSTRRCRRCGGPGSGWSGSPWPSSPGTRSRTGAGSSRSSGPR